MNSSTKRVFLFLALAVLIIIIKVHQIKSPPQSKPPQQDTIPTKQSVDQALSSFPFRLFNKSEDPNAYLRSQFEVCYNIGGPSNCYQDLANLLRYQFAFPEIIQLLTDNEKYPVVYAQCHEETHYLGRIEYERTKSIPAVYSQCSFVCHGGCYHGVIEQYLQDKKIELSKVASFDLMAEVNKICGSPQNYSQPQEYNECIHGIGHALMFVTNEDLPTSLKSCDVLSNPDDRGTCYSGVFMENSSSSTNQDHPSKFVKADDPLYPCDTLDKQYLDQCYSYQSSYFEEIYNYDWSKVAQACLKVPSEYQDKCFLFVGTNQVGFTEDSNRWLADCNLMPNAHFKDTCIRGVVVSLGTRFVGDASKTIQFCSMVAPENKETCFGQMGVMIRGWSNDLSHLDAICRQIGNSQETSWCEDGLTQPS